MFHGYLNSSVKCYWNLWNVQLRFMRVSNSLLVCNNPADSHFILILIFVLEEGDAEG